VLGRKTVQQQTDVALKFLMTLCYREPMGRLLVALALALGLATSVHAQLIRQFPASGKLGEIVGQQHPFPLLQIDNKAVRLAPGGLIFDENNRTFLHGVIPERAHVLFVQDMTGDVTRVYILRPDELEIARRRRDR
jgi:hypothetical protein